MLRVRQLSCPLLLLLLTSLFGCKKDDAVEHPDPCPVDDPGCVDWQYLTDDQGRALILHGLNTDGDAKGDGLPSITREEVLQLSSEHGFNVTRYLLFWSQVEPEPGVYDEAYLDEIETRLDWFDEAGIPVVLDMHQDCWGDSIYQLESGDPERGGVNGAPVWATLTDDEPHTQPEGFWSLCYVSADVIRAFDNFWDYDAHPSLQDHYAAMWAHVAERFGDHPAVMGYDLMNEPWEGRYVSDQETFDETLYHAFLQRMIDAIRVVDDTRWIFFEPRAFGPNQAEPSWVPRLTDPRDGDRRLVYFPHFYPVAYETGYDPSRDDYVERWQQYRLEEMAVHRTPLLVGEWSTLPFSGEENMLTYFERLHTMLDATTSGWTFWDRGVTRHSETEEGPTVMDLLVRPFPRAVAGQPIAYGFDTQTGVFTLTFERRARVGGTTDVFVPAATWPGGFVVEVDAPVDSWSSELDETTRILSIAVEASEGEYTVTLRPQ